MIEISWPLLLVNIATFLAAMVIVWKFFWGPITQLMRERTRRISDDLSQAEKGRKEVEAMEADYRLRLAGIEEEARKAITEAVARGARHKEEMAAQARAEAERIAERARQDVAQAREQLIRELRGHVTQLSLDALQGFFENKLETPARKALMDAFLRDMEKIKGVR
jgi:F-type H+-transporting ATPase subunit b